MCNCTQSANALKCSNAQHLQHDNKVQRKNGMQNYKLPRKITSKKTFNVKHVECKA